MKESERVVATSLGDDDLTRYSLVSRRPAWADDHNLEGYAVSSGFLLRTVNESALFKLVSDLTAKKHREPILELTIDSDPSKTLIKLGDRTVKVRTNTREHEICKLLFKNKRKIWQWDDLAERIGILDPNTNHKLAIYKTNYDLKKKLGQLAPDVLIVTDKTVSLNPIFKVRRST